jgi:hypothetical protein
MDPLIVTLEADPASTQRFEALRAAHFPPGRNLVPAHLTLFHALPGDDLPVVTECLIAEARRLGEMPFDCPGAMSLGRVATALRILCPPAVALKRRMLGALRGRDVALTAQDAAGLHPHVTVQNKVSPELAQATRARLAAELAPMAGRFVGLSLWHYRGGPWEAEATYRFVGGGRAGGPDSTA